jgi:hypothetical protein
VFVAYFKYMNFFLEKLNGLFATHFSIGNVLLRLGISFFVFQKSTDDDGLWPVATHDRGFGEVRVSAGLCA